MSKKRPQAATRKKKRKARATRRARLIRFVPWLAVGIVAVGLASVLFLVGVGGNGGGPSTTHPAGYEPPALGQEDAPVEFVLWEDFQCPFCKRFTLNTFSELERQFVDQGQVRFVWRNFQRYGSESLDAAVAAYCAGEQGQFWQYKKSLFQHQQGIQSGVFTRSGLSRFAQDLGLDATAFNGCLTSEADNYGRIIAADRAMARDEGVTGTPTFFINGQQVVGAQSTETFASIINEALAEAGAQ